MGVSLHWTYHVLLVIFYEFTIAESTGKTYYLPGEGMGEI